MKNRIKSWKNKISNYVDSLIYTQQPQINDYVLITWLPNKQLENGRETPNVYIGYYGKDMELYNNGGFVCFNGSSKLCITNKKFRYKIVNPWDYNTEQIGSKLDLQFNF